MWGTAFYYDETNKGLVMNFTEGLPNPNDKVNENVIPPAPCASHTVSEEGRTSACGTKVRHLWHRFVASTCHRKELDCQSR
jgi:hypothetical protein